MTLKDKIEIVVKLSKMKFNFSINILRHKTSNKVLIQITPIKNRKNELLLKQEVLFHLNNFDIMEDGFQLIYILISF